MHIAVAGNIGSGKTTLAQVLSAHYQWEMQLEDESGNPYLQDFYMDMERWSFHLQIYFLDKRLQGLVDIKNNASTVIQDRSLFEDACIFAPTLHDLGLMSQRDFNNYTALYTHLLEFITPPDLLIYIRSSVPKLEQQIHKRGRDYERNIQTQYLTKLNERYENWIVTYPDKHLIINADLLDFTKKDQLDKVIGQIDQELSNH